MASSSTSEPEAEQPTTLAEAIGGPRGLIEPSLPAVAFVGAYSAPGNDTETAAPVASGGPLGPPAARLARRESPRHALAGLIGVGFAAFIAVRSGKAENFYLPGLLLNAAYASAFLISLAIGRPLVAEIVSRLDGEGEHWRDDPQIGRAHV